MFIAAGGNGFFGLGALTLEGSKSLLGFNRIWASVAAIFIVIGRILGGGVCHLLCRGDVLSGIEVANKNIGELALLFGDEVVFVTQFAHDAWVVGEGRHEFANAFFDSLGDHDLAFAGE